VSFKSGFVTIAGRPNTGKSTLLNHILKQKIAIISDKVQTTRRRLRGIYNDERGQIVFIDTPGIHKPFHKLGEYLMEETKLAIPDSDLILFMVDARSAPGPGDKWIINNVLETDKPVLMIVNKIDLIKNTEERSNNVEQYLSLFAGKKIRTILVSAKTGRNVDDLLKSIFRLLPEGPRYYPEDDITDQSTRAIAEEIVREKVLINTEEELPHSVAVIIDSYKQEKDLTSIFATIYVERDSQKGMIIGKNGSMLKKIGTLARKEIEEMTEEKIYLELLVKVKKNWRKNTSALRQFGYQNR